VALRETKRVIDEIKILTKLSVLLIRRMSSLKSAIILSVVLFTTSLVPKCIIIYEYKDKFISLFLIMVFMELILAPLTATR
jgi:hypothetical protein